MHCFALTICVTSPPSALAYVYAYICIHTHTNTHTHTHTHTHTDTHVHLCVCECVCVCIQIYKYMSIYSCPYIYTHTNIHTQTLSLSLSLTHTHTYVCVCVCVCVYVNTYRDGVENPRRMLFGLTHHKLLENAGEMRGKRCVCVPYGVHVYRVMCMCTVVCMDSTVSCACVLYGTRRSTAFCTHACMCTVWCLSACVNVSMYTTDDYDRRLGFSV